MHADAMQRHVPPRNRYFAMQKPASLESMRRDILVVPARYGIARENGIAVMTMVVDRVAAVRKIAPYGISQELCLGLRRPVSMTRGIPVVSTLHLLQEDDVGAERAQTVPQLVNDQSPIEQR